MPTQGKSLADVGRATRKGWRVTLVRLLVVILVAGLGTLAYGHTTARGDGLPGGVDPLQGAQQPTATPTTMPQQQAVVPPDVQSLAQEVELLKVKVEAELEASEKANERNFRLFTFVSGFVGLFGLVTLISTWIKGRQEHEDYQSERRFYEERVMDHEFRHREENLRATSMFALQEANLEQVNVITTAIAKGAEDNVKSLKTILSTFQEMMNLRVEEAKDARTLMRQMRRQLKELKEAQRRQVEELLASAVRLRRPRQVYASPDPDLRRQMVGFGTQMDLMQRGVLDRHTGVASPAENRRYGEIYLRRGIIAYYDNDIPKSREMLKIAAQFFPIPVSETIQNMPRDERLPIAFTQYYLALIEKNYGDMAAARAHIENSYKVYGPDEPTELMTPITRAEILSYQGDKVNAQAACQEVLARAQNLPKPLGQHDATCVVRAHLYFGNTCYIEKDWEGALQHYQDTLQADVKRYYSYYTYHSLAQVYDKLGEKEKAIESRRQAYEELINTGHLQTKTALDTRILLNALAFLCTRDDDPDKAGEYRKAIQDLWPQIQKVNGLELRLFSLEKKQQVSKDNFRSEVLG